MYRNLEKYVLKTKVVQWTRSYMNQWGGKTKAVIGISGGVDSSVCAAVLVEAIGKDRVIGVLMPNGTQADIDKSYELVNHLDIPYHVINISDSYIGLTTEISKQVGIPLNDCYLTNTPARTRMTTLYGVAALYVDARVVNTCNLSEDYVGYSTKYGDAAGDFSILASLTKTEVKAIGYELGLPEDLVEKIPTDGMSGKSDEEKLGFSYPVLDTYITTGVCEDAATKERIDWLHKINLHKQEKMPRFEKN